MPLTNDMVRIRTTQLVEKTARATRIDVRSRSYSEETITPEISLTVSAVLAAFTILSEDLSSLPLLLYERRGRNKFRAVESMYYRLMHDRPNEEHTAMIFREIMVGHLLGWGNFFAQPIFDKAGNVAELWPLRPDKMEVKRFEGERIYTYQTTDGKPRIFLSEEILHIPAFGFDGLIGYSRIALARNAIGLSISTEKFGSKFFSNGAQPGIVYKHPGELSDDAYAHLKESLDEKAGVDEAHKPIILEEGMGIEKLGIDPDDAQFLETRKFQVGEIARIFRVPPHMIGDVDKSTSWGSGIDSQEQGYVNHTLRPWATRIEQHLNSRLLLKQDQDTLYYEHLMDALLRGDIAVRYEAYVKAINNGFMSRNEVREKENLNSRKGLDVMLIPANLTTVDDTSGAINPDAAAAAFEPLWKDAIARVLKREANDVLGASKRWQLKGQAGTFNAWVDQFYQVDHPAFTKKQFQPLIDAHERIFESRSHIYMDDFVADFFSARRTEVRSLSAQELSDGMSAYAAAAAEEFFTFVSLGFSIPRIIDPDGPWEEEDGYE
jgi:HK97 family phage portal protein